jgi:transposase
MNGKQNRKRWSAAEKMRIVLAGMEPGVEVSDLCRQEGLNPTMYYTWKRILLGAADIVFEKKEAKTSAREERLSKELTRAKDVIAEITAENLDLKKRSRPRGPWPGSPRASAGSACRG